MSINSDLTTSCPITIVASSDEESDFAVKAAVNTWLYSLFSCIIASIGVFTNGLLLGALIKKKDLRDKSHLLVAALAIECVCACLGIIATDIMALIGRDKNVSQYTCLAVTALAIVACSATNALILLFGIDRLLLLKHPISYLRWSNATYVSVCVAIASTFGLSMLVLAWLWSNKRPLPYCMIVYCFNGAARRIWEGFNGVICLCVLVIYIYVGAAVRKGARNAGPPTVTADYRRLLISLTVIAGVYAFNVCIPLIYILFFKLIIPLSPATFYQYAQFASLTLTAQFACAPLVYYTCSPRLRAALRDFLGLPPHRHAAGDGHDDADGGAVFLRNKQMTMVDTGID